MVAGGALRPAPPLAARSGEASVPDPPAPPVAARSREASVPGPKSPISCRWSHPVAAMQLTPIAAIATESGIPVGPRLFMFMGPLVIRRGRTFHGADEPARAPHGAPGAPD